MSHTAVIFYIPWLLYKLFSYAKIQNGTKIATLLDVRTETTIIGLSFVFWVMAWVGYAAVDAYWFNRGSFITLLISDVSAFEVHIIWLIVFLAAGIVLSKETGQGNALGKTLELSSVRKDGTEITIELSLSAIQIKGNWHATGIIRDITKRKIAEEELKRHRERLEDMVEERTSKLTAINESLKQGMVERMRVEKDLYKSERFFSTIFDSIRDPFSIIDQDYKIIKANSAYAAMRNKPLPELIGKRCYEVLQKRHSVCENCVVGRTFKSATPCTKDKILTLPDGLKLWVGIYTYPIFDGEGTVSHVIEYTRDITDWKKSEEEKERLINKLEHLSKTDSLTGLLNRRALLEKLEYEIERAKRYSSAMSLILCDVDYFKEVNDIYGHNVGDAALKALSSVFRKVLRGMDVAGRYGGDEFMVILPETTIEGAKNLAKRIHSAVKSTYIQLSDSKSGKISLSLGVTCFKAGIENSDTLIKRADDALYSAKRVGGNRIYVIASAGSQSFDCQPSMNL